MHGQQNVKKKEDSMFTLKFFSLITVKKLWIPNGKIWTKYMPVFVYAFFVLLQ